MKSYSTIVSGKEMSRFINLPDEFQEVDLKVVISPIKKKKDRFAKLFLNPIRVHKITIPSKNDQSFIQSDLLTGLCRSEPE